MRPMVTLRRGQHGNAPVGTKLYYDKHGQPLLLKREIIATGDELTSATARPIRTVHREHQAGLAGRRSHAGRDAREYRPPHGSGVHREAQRAQRSRWQAGDPLYHDEKVINNARIDSVFGNAFASLT